MSLHPVETLKKGAFLHDLGKLLNWSGVLHPLDGGRVLKYLGFDETVVGMALYHHGKKHAQFIKKWIGDTERDGLRPRSDYDQYIVLMSYLVDQLMASFDRLGGRDIKRTSPVVLRNPLTHLPLNNQFSQFDSIIRRGGDDAADGKYLREWVLSEYLPGSSLRPLRDNDDADATDGERIYLLDDTLRETPLLKALFECKESDFNTLYHHLRSREDWQKLTQRHIPQGHHPPTDTLALWYHWQFSSALMGLYYLEGTRDLKAAQSEYNQLLQNRRGQKPEQKKPLHLKVGLLYVRLAGLTEYFNGAYRLPDFSGTEAMGQALKDAVREQLLETRTDDGLPLVWEDNFFYQGHDDFLVMVPVDELGMKAEDFVYQIGENDSFRPVWERALDTETVLQRAVQKLLNQDKVRRILAVSPGDEEAFGDASRLVTNLKRLVRVEIASRCFAEFLSGGVLTSRYGLVWNQLRAEAAARLPTPYPGLTHFAGDVCDSCRVNLAGHDPDPARPREWVDVDWRRSIVRDEVWPNDERGQPLRYWVFRSASETPGEGDKLCHACLLRRILGHGTSLERIAARQGEGEEKARIAVIKGNVNRTRWFIGGSLRAETPLKNADSTYAKVWRNELSAPLAGSSLCKGARLAPADVKQRLRQQAEWALGNNKPADTDEREQAILSQVSEAERSINDWPTEFSNPWTPYPLDDSVERLIEWLFYGSPNFCREAAAQDDHDLPTPSRTMTVSQIIQEAVGKVRPLVDEIIPERWRPVVYTAGDEFLVICRAEDAPNLAWRIFKTVVAHLNSVPEDQVEALDDYLPVTLAMGMVAAKRKHPIYGLLELVDQLVTNAKAAYPNRNAIDFENVVGGVDEVNLDRQQYGRLWLSRRPLTLADFSRLMEDVTVLRQAGESFPQRQLQQVSALIARTPADPVSDAGINYASRQAAALAYVIQQEDGTGWQVVRRACVEGTFQDLWGLYRWPRGEEENT